METSQQRIKEDGIKIGAAFAVVLAVLKIAFYQESFFSIVKLALAMFWLFIIPGFMLLYLFSQKLDFIEQFIIGAVLGLAFFGSLGYNLRLIGLKIPVQNWALPILGIALGLAALLKRKKGAPEAKD
ncbi:hypothetical protein HYU13_04370 [Candidatus Woesearchaeota archaeon]|nr:hypothetical protein [Candidatus Woesearchaeota archaeon]